MHLLFFIDVYQNVLMEIGYIFMQFQILACIYTRLMHVDIKTTMCITGFTEKNKFVIKRICKTQTTRIRIMREQCIEMFCGQ